jgi:hypothetical protein
LVALFEALVPSGAAVVMAAAVFAIPHGARGNGWAERSANVTTAFVFGVRLVPAWNATESIAFLIGDILASY